MGAGQWFWLIYVICVVFSGFWSFRGDANTRYWSIGGLLPVFVLLFLLGWGVFGSPIK